MGVRVCMCCGEPMSENDLEHFPNPNVCATWLNLTWEKDEFASTISSRLIPTTMPVLSRWLIQDALRLAGWAWLWRFRVRDEQRLQPR